MSGVDRSAQDFSFAPYLVQFAARALHPTKNAILKLSENLDGGMRDPGLRIQTQRAMRESLAAGSRALDSMNRQHLGELAKIVDVEFVANNGPVELFHWIRDIVTVTSTNAVYGPANPFLRKELADGLW